MSITKSYELEGMVAISEIVAIVLKEMREYCSPGMTTRDVDEYGGKRLKQLGARSAPKLTYSFPGYTCISVNNEIAHGIPSGKKFLQEGDLINIDVSAEMNGFWADNGGSFVLGKDIHHHQSLVDASRNILYKAIDQIRDGVNLSATGRLIQSEARNAGFKVIRNLAGHGVGRNLHEFPHEIVNYYDPYNQIRFTRNSVVAIETFISSCSSFAVQQPDGWTLIGNKGGYVAQHEHTIVVTDDAPRILTLQNGIWDNEKNAVLAKR